MRSPLILATLVSGLAISLAAMAVAFKLAPIWVVALTSLLSAAVIATTVIRGKRQNRSEANQRRDTASLIWPLSLVLGAALGIVDVVHDGLKVADIVGATVWLIVLVAYLLAYRKQRKNGSTV